MAAKRERETYERIVEMNLKKKKKQVNHRDWCCRVNCRIKTLFIYMLYQEKNML
jgi:hypothetical protein